MKNTALLKHLCLLALPLIGQNLISVSVGVADNIMVGSLGELAVDGVHLANQVQNILQMLVMGISAAIILLAAQYWGRRDVKSIKDIVAIGLKVCLVSGGVINAAVFISPYGVLRVFSDNNEAIAEGIKYLRVMAFSYMFFCVTNTLMASMRCVEQVRIALAVSLTTLVVDIGLNYVLIFGHFGFPALGVQGAAIATLTARVIETGIMIVYVRFIDGRLRIRFRELFGFNYGLAKDFFRYGLPVMAGDALWGLAGSMQGAIMGRLGTETMAAQSVTLMMFQFVTVVVWGFSGAASVIIGKTVGSGDVELVKKYARLFQIVFVCVGVLTSLSFLGLRDFMISLYDFTPETNGIVKQFMTVMAIATLGTAYHAPCFTGIIRAGGDVSFVIKVDFICAWFVVLPLAWLSAFVFHHPPVAVFFFLKCDQFFKWIIAIVKTNRFKWIKNLTRETEGGAAL
ncbi:MAG: MATE family efflux transporter [Clostridiales bacterium]|jgi:putative MATE family efflux protein|nr:MATE family efflux transporter [Clostridiales bacterium]